MGLKHNNKSYDVSCLLVSFCNEFNSYSIKRDFYFWYRPFHNSFTWKGITFELKLAIKPPIRSTEIFYNLI